MFSMYNMFALLNGSHNGKCQFFSNIICFVNKVPCSKMKAHDFVFPGLFSLFFCEILVVSTNIGQFCQTLNIYLPLQRTYLVELFVPCVCNDLLVMKQSKTMLEKGRIIQPILLTLQKSIDFGSWVVSLQRTRIA